MNTTKITEHVEKVKIEEYEKTGNKELVIFFKEEADVPHNHIYLDIDDLTLEELEASGLLESENGGDSE